MDAMEAGKAWARFCAQREDEQDATFASALVDEDRREKNSEGILVCEGDSWFDYRPGSNKDVLKWLRESCGFDVREASPKYGHLLLHMVEDPDQIGAVHKRLRKIKDDGDVPRAILLSAGGNDLASEGELGLMMNPPVEGLPPFRKDLVDSFFDTRIATLFRLWIFAVDELCTMHFEHPIPIVLHGYARAVPDGRQFGSRFFKPFPGPWLKPEFERKGYWSDDTSDPADEILQRTTMLMGLMIERFNATLAALASEIPHVHHAPTMDVLSNELEGKKYREDWANELHPVSAGFQRIARKIAETIYSQTQMP